MKHLKLFKTQAEFDLAAIQLPNVSYVEENSIVYYNYQKNEIDYSTQYFTIRSLENDNEISFTNDIQYSLDNGNNWNTLLVGNTILINENDAVMFKLNNPKPDLTYGIGSFAMSKNCNVEGNIMSLIYNDDFKFQTDLSQKISAFKCLFQDCKIVDASNLILPATKLSIMCYYSMFEGNTELVNVPKFPALDLTDSCYRGMFMNCTSLVEAPELPATTLAGYCYQYMFYGCSSLTKAPKLHVNTLTNDCYYAMFYNCINLNKITMLATDISAHTCLLDWVDNVAEQGTFVKNPDLSIDTIGYGINGIPEGWVVENAQID